MTLDTQQIHHLVTQPRTLVLGMDTPDGPWTAPVYFVYDRGAFYFFSNPKSRHLNPATPGAAASIFQDADRVDKIVGLQMQGAIEPVSRTGEKFKTMAAYVKKFNFLEKKFGKQILENPQFFAEKFHARPHKFIPGEIWLSNHGRTGSGRQPVPLEVMP
ncbi:MAG: pyridoxamine 5'-phosphate oxidase family protein [Desulfobacterales bacterium]|nr:pyridoxamine 5'-phosphate oxidase family protein [Desulfobacterales bacterium]